MLNRPGGNQPDHLFNHPDYHDEVSTIYWQRHARNYMAGFIQDVPDVDEVLSGRTCVDDDDGAESRLMQRIPHLDALSILQEIRLVQDGLDLGHGDGLYVIVYDDCTPPFPMSKDAPTSRWG